MAKKGGLGKGLSSLIGDMDEVYNKELGLSKSEVREIALENIKPNPFQPRKHFDEEALNELANSIKEYGLIQPIIVLEKDDYFVIVAGERRFRAAELLGFESIKALICDASEEKLRELALIENIQRENLNPIELANSYKDLIEVYQITQENLANIIHKSRTQITNTLRLLNLDEKTQKLIIEGKISQGHAKVLVGLDKNNEKMVVDSIIGQKLSVRDTEKIVQKIKNKVEDEEFDNEMEKLLMLLKKSGFECKNKNTELTIRLTSVDKIKKLAQVLV